MKKNKSTLVRNEAKAKATQPVAEVQRFTINLLPKQVRTETLEGRLHTVVPMVMLTEGVFNGSSGPLLYGEDELGKTPQSWDHKPIVMYHPEEDGEGISACQPDVINNRKVGIMLNTKFDSVRKKLVSEAWIENEKADKVDERVMAAIKSNEIMEVSTGVFVDKEEAEGNHGGRDYTGIARNFRPDHLALLPDQIGACSIEDGAGLCRNTSAKDRGKAYDNLRKMMREIGLVGNELSFDNIRNDLSDALRKKLNVGATSDMNKPWPWVLDVYSNFFIYDFDNKLFQLGYTANDTGVSLSDEDPKQVKRVTKYETVKGAFVGNRDQSKQNNTMKKLTPEEKKAKIDALIANKDSGWSEDQRPVLDALKDETLVAQEKALTKQPDPTAAAAAAVAATTNQQQPAAPATATAAPVQNQQQPQAFDYAAWLKSAPLPVQEMVNNGVSTMNDEKVKLIAEITKNSKNVFTAEQLGTKPLNELRGIAALARGSAAPDPSVVIPNFYGAGAPTLTDNSGDRPVITPLELPTMNFENNDEGDQKPAARARK